ncbi:MULTISPECIES: hypothetical protein [unclassified Sphingobium]|uniref:hypothetical protein n=1 Tax=unclassified Sphingobium TaxID=2611147 RepID=UPI002224669B|nr:MULTISPECIES: hypothetical protein [unclassified Sphingobium]MCW2393760.1 hypothetical protein [Sphingobium sp. B8D3B]MCW2417273.1 hypothetical protein [Sphingobium sp. B8D3C]
MADLDIRVSGDRATVEDAVALCEGAFAYDRAVITALLANLAESMDEVLFADLSKLQKQTKYGLTDPSALAFTEAGFADRIVANFCLCYGTVFATARAFVRLVGIKPQSLPSKPTPHIFRPLPRNLPLDVARPLIRQTAGFSRNLPFDTSPRNGRNVPGSVDPYAATAC